MNQEFQNFPNNCKSMLCKHLTPEVFVALKDKKQVAVSLYKMQ